MNRKLFSLLTAGALVLLSSCGDSVVDASDQVKASLNVVVQDASTGELLGDVSVKLTSSGEEKTTVINNGSVSFDDLYIGTHILLIEKEGYASTSQEATISNASQYDNLASERTLGVNLYPKTASLSGTLYYPSKEDLNVSLPATGAKVLIQYTTGNFLDRYDTATVNSEGKFAFENLAAVGTSYNIRALEFEPGSGDTRTFASFTFAATSLQNNIPAHNTTKNQYENGVTPFFLVSYPTTVGPTEPIVFKFSDKINTDKIINKSVVYISSPNQAANYEWKDSTFTVTPIGEWNGSTIYFSGSVTLESVSGNDYFFYPYNGVSVNNTVDLSAVSVSGFKTTTISPVTGTSIELEWNEVEDITYYNLYVRKPGSSTFDLVYNYITSNSYTYNYFYVDVAGTYTFAIRATNSNSQTDFATIAVPVTAAP